jgi:hypothetical protein
MKEGGKPLEAYSQEQDDMRRQAVSDWKERYLRFNIGEELDQRKKEKEANANETKTKENQAGKS